MLENKPVRTDSVTKKEFLADIKSSKLSAAVIAAIENWIAQQPGADLQKVNISRMLADLTEVERNTASTLDDAERISASALVEEDKADADETVRALEIQAEALKAGMALADQVAELTLQSGAN